MTEADQTSSTILARGPAIRVFLCLASAYVVSYALRAINAAIAPELTAEFGLTNAELGSLSSAYFIGFAALQLPLGVWLDRFGTRRTCSLLLGVAFIGCMVFIHASNVTQLWLGRALIGAGLAGALMGSLRAYRFWFAPDRQQQLMALMLVAGTAGAMLTTVPSRMLLPAIGWQGLFWLAAGVLVVASAAIFFLLPRDEPVHKKNQSEQQRNKSVPANRSGFAGYRDVFGSRFFWRYAPIGFIMLASAVSFQTLWAGPWFTRVLHTSADQAGQALFAFNLVMMASYILVSALIRRLNKRGISPITLALGSAVLIVAMHIVLSFTESQALGLTIFLAYAVLLTPFTLVQSWVCLSFPDWLTGRALTSYNLMMFSGVFLMQWVFGVLVDVSMNWVSTEELAFRLSLKMWIALEIGAILWVVFFRAEPISKVATKPDSR